MKKKLSCLLLLLLLALYLLAAAGEAEFRVLGGLHAAVGGDVVQGHFAAAEDATKLKDWRQTGAYSRTSIYGTVNWSVNNKKMFVILHVNASHFCAVKNYVITGEVHYIKNTYIRLKIKMYQSSTVLQ